ncbi:MAG: 4-oxalomesaconate tautomerase [Acidimicrobiales bacterium]
MLMRGGSSKGLYFLRSDLPNEPERRDKLLMELMGSPDDRQIDGLGGAHPLTSKVAIVGPSDRGNADIDYLFLQVDVDTGNVTDRQNCGNLLAGVAPFAIERGLIRLDDDATTASVPIHMINTDAIATATVVVDGGRPVYGGTTQISGVPGAAAPIRLDFADIAGGTTGSLLPSGSARDTIDGIDCTLVDNGMPVVVLRADALGVNGCESCAELEANVTLRNRLETIRLQAGKLMNLGDVADLTVPKLTLVSSPQGAGAMGTRTFIPHRCHDAIGVLGAVSVATAALMPSSPAHDLLVPTTTGSVVLEHPTGTFEARVVLDDEAAEPTVIRAGIVRTARKLMDGTAFPRDY